MKLDALAQRGAAPLGEDLVPRAWLNDVAEIVDALAAAAEVPAPLNLVDVLGRWHALIRVTNPKRQLLPLVVVAAYLLTGLSRDGVSTLDGAGNTWAILPAQTGPLFARAAFFFAREQPKRKAAELEATEEDEYKIKKKRKKGGKKPKQKIGPATILRPRFALRPALAVPFKESEMMEVCEKMLKVIRAGRLTAPWFFDWFREPRRQCWPPLSEAQ